MRPTATLVAAALVALVGFTRRADAYPQFQLTRDATCSGCHISPAGGGLLDENGLIIAEAISQAGTAPEFFYGKVPTPSWLVLGGDLRGATGYVQTPEKLLAAFPMQVEVYGHARLGAGLSLYVDAGYRSSQVGNEATTRVWSREHYLMWEQRPGEASGLFVRAGRFMPVFGLRLAEHPTYTRKWGGTPLYAETYGLAVEYINPRYELHATGFIEDPVIDTPEHSSGGAALAEYRVGDKLSIGAEGMYTRSTDEEKFRVGLVAKLLLEGPGTLLQLEGQFMNQLIDAGGAPKQIIAHLLASKFLTRATMLDIGIGVFDENIRLADLHREAFDLNLHWFATSHVEAIFTGRFETLAFGQGGPNAGYALVQLHYRL